MTKSDWNLILSMSLEVKVQEAWRKAMKLDRWQESIFVLKYDHSLNNLYVIHEQTGKELIYHLDQIIRMAKKTHNALLKETVLN